MEEKNTFCRDCGTENEPQYVYCKNCGTPLKAAPKNEGYTEDFYKNGEPFDRGQSFVDEDGIATEELMAFIGRKAPAFMRRFEMMRQKGNSLSWCWPTAILGLLFGPLGSALWFFYRKLYKAAWMLVAIGTISIVITTALFMANFPVDISQVFNEAVSVMQTVPEEEQFETLRQIFAPVYEAAFNYQNKTADALNEIIALTTTILSSLLAYGIYKKRAVSVIYKYRRNNIDSRYYHLGLSTMGGTSGGMVALGLVLMAFLPSIVSLVITMVVLF